MAGIGSPKASQRGSSSSSVARKIYRRVGVPEVWMWRRGQIEIRALRTEASGYERQPGRVLLPTRSIEKIELCLRMDSWLEARKAFHESLH